MNPVNEAVKDMQEHLNRQLFTDAGLGLTKEVSLGLERGAKVNCINEEGNSPISHAIANGHHDVTKLLAERKANLSGICIFNGKKIDAHSLALRCGQYNIAIMLKQFMRPK